MIEWLEVFLIMCVLDFVWGAYTHALVDRSAAKAGIFSAAIMLCSGGVTINYVTNHWLLIPTLAGAFVGTYVYIRWGEIIKYVFVGIFNDPNGHKVGLG